MPDLSHRSRSDLVYAIEHTRALSFARGRPWLVTGPIEKLRSVVARAASTPGASIAFPPATTASAPASPPPAPPKRKPISSHVAPSPRKERSAMPTKTTAADHHAALAKLETRFGLSSGAHLGLVARAERVERASDPKTAERRDMKATIDTAMGRGTQPSGVRLEGLDGRLQVFRPTARR